MQKEQGTYNDGNKASMKERKGKKRNTTNKQHKGRKM
jgi:hypothetical protein